MRHVLGAVEGERTTTKPADSKLVVTADAESPLAYAGTGIAAVPVIVAPETASAPKSADFAPTPKRQPESAR